MTYRLYVFDAYGTLFDVHSAVARQREAVGPEADRLSDIWRAKQLEFTWTRALMGAYKPFWSLTEEALDFALACVPAVDRAVKPALLDAYKTLSAYPEVRDVLEGLKARGAKTAILSNGSPQMLDSAVTSAGLKPLLDACLSVDVLKTYKTTPKVYGMVLDHFETEAGDVSFQSSNRWDVAGAVAFGLPSVWINRSGAPDEYTDLSPDRVLPTLAGLLED
ncbi:MAG: haloacid dehalogenase type II [Pseudomonadota bacterium]|nr:haloacid dehalogenase type II [Pseudomonadota bacterium]